MEKEFLKKVAWFLIRRCEGLGYLPLVTKVRPDNRSFQVSPGPEAVFVKIFGHFNYQVNTVHARFAVLDPGNLRELGSFDDQNLCLTETEKVLLASEVLLISSEKLEQLCPTLKNLQDLYDLFLSENSRKNKDL
jgi:hypothetical protein